MTGLLLFALASAPTSPPTAASVDHVPDPPRLQWESEGFYLMADLGPGVTMHLHGFNPVIRYGAELGMRWERDRAHISVGTEGALLQYLEAKRVGGGVHGVVTVGRGPFYARGGVGVAMGIPGSHNDQDTRSAVSGLLGLGLEGGDEVRGRIGLDYQVAFDKSGRLNNTVFLSLRLRFG